LTEIVQKPDHVGKEVPIDDVIQDKSNPIKAERMDNPVQIAASNRLSEHSKANLIDLEPNESPSILHQDGIAKNKIVETKL
jgi:hypothetical protein